MCPIIFDLEDTGEIFYCLSEKSQIYLQSEDWEFIIIPLMHDTVMQQKVSKRIYLL